jgi:hypothetical protein
MTPEEKEQIIQQALATRGFVFDGPKIARTLLEQEGVPSEVIDLVEPLMQARAEYRRACAEAGRNLFPVQPLPQGALPVYDRDPVRKAP